MISYRFVPISSQKGVLFLRHPVEAAVFRTRCLFETYYHAPTI